MIRFVLRVAVCALFGVIVSYSVVWGWFNNSLMNATRLGMSTGSLVCDDGPNAASVPVYAQAAGFTHCMANEDMTNAAFSNTATFIDNCGATKQFRWYWTWFLSNNRSPLNCSDIQMVTDGSLSQVMQFTLTPTQWKTITATNGNPNAANLTFLGPNSYSGNNCTNPCLPLAMYIELKIRFDGTGWDQAGGPGSNGHLNYYNLGINRRASDGGTYAGYIESEWFENIADRTFNPSSTQCPVTPCYDESLQEFNGSCGLGNSCDGGFPGRDGLYGGFDISAGPPYRKLGVLMTIDPINQKLAKCWWVDDVQAGYGTGVTTACDVLNYPDSFIDFQHDDCITFAYGLLNSTPGVTTVPFNQTAYIQSLQIWECASWQTTDCAGTYIDHWPFP